MCDEMSKKASYCLSFKMKAAKCAEEKSMEANAREFRIDTCNRSLCLVLHVLFGAEFIVHLINLIRESLLSSVINPNLE